MKKKLCLFMLLGNLLCAVAVGNTTGFEFVDQDISEIAYAISLVNDFPLVVDDTVSGRATFRFTGGDFDTAFDSFLLANRLYVQKEAGRWVLTRLRIGQGDCGLIELDAFEVLPSRIFEGISLSCDEVVVHDLLPAVPVSVHVSNVTVAEACALLLQQFDGYTVSQEGPFVRVLKKDEARAVAAWSAVENTETVCTITMDDGGLYSAEIEKAPFETVLKQFTELSGIEFCSLVKADASIARSVFAGRPFEETLRLLCRQANVAYTLENGLYVFYSSQDERSSLETGEKEWRRYTLLYKNTEKFLPLLQGRFPRIEIMAEGQCSFSIRASVLEDEKICAFIQERDVPDETHLVNLKYIQAAAFLSLLPPGFSGSQFSPTGKSNTLFFLGSQEQYDLLETLLPAIDAPEDRISYDLLIVQSQKTKSNVFKVETGARTAARGDRNALSTQVGSSFLFNVDVASIFGLTFAQKLQAAVMENTAEIFADTTLHGVSGVPISFQNTSTYRYRDPYINTETGVQVDTGVTREIVSGLVLEITGVVSGDGMVTTEVTASFSRQGEGERGATNIPPTSEKLVTTRVRGRSGEIIVLSGLLQDDSIRSDSRTPLLGRIPLIGWLFRQREKAREKNEMVIYLIPHVEDDSSAAPQLKGRLVPKPKILTSEEVAAWAEKAARKAAERSLFPVSAAVAPGVVPGGGKEVK